MSWIKKSLILFIFVFLAVSCSQKQALKKELEPVAQNQKTASSTVGTTLKVLDSPAALEVLGESITNTEKLAKPAQGKATNTIIDNSEALKQAQQETEDAKIALQALLEQQADTEARQKQIILEQQAQQEAIIATKQQAEQQAQIDYDNNQEKLETQIKAIAEQCLANINTYKQQILDLTNKYNQDVASLHGRGIPLSLVQGKQAKFLNDTNTQIDEINSQIEQEKFDCTEQINQVK